MGEKDDEERVKVTLYRCTCEHCDRAEEALRKLAVVYGALFEVQRVASDARLRGFAGWSTPIVAVDGVGVTQFRVDVKAWEDAIKNRGGPRPVELEGVVVDMCCYFKRGPRPAGHEACGRECFAAGGPIGIRSADGRIYLALPDKRDTRPFVQLKELPEQEVRITGEKRFRDGISGVVVSDVEVL
jgi:hypothetical protein